MPLVSVIIASHNRSAFLPRAVESAQAASTNVEVIVGILIQTKDSGAMAEAIIRLARDPQLRKRNGEGARKRYEQLFSPEAVLPLLLDTYQRLVGGELPESPASSKNCGIHPWACEEVVWI